MNHSGKTLLFALSLSLLIHFVCLDFLGWVPDLDAPGQMPRLNALLHRNTDGRLGDVSDWGYVLPDKLPRVKKAEQRDASGPSAPSESFERSGDSSLGPDAESLSEPRFPAFRPMSGEELQAMARIALGKKLREARVPLNEVTLTIFREGAGFRVEADVRDNEMLKEYIASVLRADLAILPLGLAFPLELEFLSPPPSGPL